MGKDGAAVVDTALNKGVIKHPYLDANKVKTEANGNLWYLSSPSALPYTQGQASYISDSCKNLTQTLFTGEKVATNYFWNIIVNGYGVGKVSDVENGKDADECIKNINTQNFGTYLDYKREAFDGLKTFFKF